MKNKLFGCLILTVAAFFITELDQVAVFALDVTEVTEEIVVVGEVPAPGPAEVAPVERGVVKNFEFGVGLEIMAAYNYHESNFMRLDGTQFGAYGSVSYIGSDPWFLQLYLSYVGGDITYDGGAGSGYSYRSIKGDVGNSIFNFRLTAGFDLARSPQLEKATIMPYSGIGYRYLVNHLEDIDISGVTGYEREQSYWYLPLGISASTPLSSNEKLRLGVKAEFDILLIGTHHADLYGGLDFT